MKMWKCENELTNFHIFTFFTFVKFEIHENFSYRFYGFGQNTLG